ncbi:hypothetical protein D9758_004623 [Tetrapyrgos nigripes]|uniref:F-box domain-containing protein n=1 Tax=Tetrapyrgos nigripes TaxID=182062 RepID=A0A8H5LYH7_9AGAR|nr:hypothetical protein D9758_004623 [Tetrapyrgos nigripes]
MLAHFAPELIALVIRQLRPCRDVLKACSLVCRSWCHPSQLMLFSRITLSSDEDCRRWKEYIHESPHIATLISEVSIASNVDINTQSVAQDLANLLTNVQCLEIDRFSASLGEEELEFVRRFREVRRLRLNKATWTAQDRMLEIFQAMPAIMSLMLIGSLAGNEGQGHGIEADGSGTITTSSTGSVVLQNLAELVLASVECNETILEFLMSSSLDFSALRSLELQLGHVPESFQLRGIMISRLFDAFLERVLSLPENLVLSLPSVFSTVPYLGQSWRTCLPHLISHRSLASLYSVQTLIIRLPRLGYFHILLAHTWELVNTIASAPRLQKLRLEISFTVNSEPWKGGFNFVHELLEWKFLDERFSDRTRFPCLRRVEIGVGFVSLRQRRHADFEHSTVYKTVFNDLTKWMSGRMPGLHGKGMLHFDMVNEQ